MKNGPLRAAAVLDRAGGHVETASTSRPSTVSTGMPNVRGMSVRSSTADTEVGKPPPAEPSAPSLLFSQTYTTGSDHSAAKFSDS